MPGGRAAQAIRQLRDLLQLQAPGDEADRNLLERFAVEREEAAFAALVQRHGRMVLGVCRRVLGDLHAAEDAFQATFLILARKAATLRRQGNVAGWLFTVAHRTALRARAAASQRRAREAEVSPMDRVPTPALDPELRPLIDAELSRLPAKYRAPLVLCYFEGLSNDEAALHLGWPAGTVKGRLARARDLLRQRLAGKGLALSAAALGSVLTEHAAAAGVPGVLSDVTISAALQFAAGQATPVGISTAALTLAEGGLRAMTWTKLKLAAVVLLGLGVIGTGAGVVAQQLRPTVAPAPVAPAPVADAKPGTDDRKDDAKGNDELVAALQASDRLFVAKIVRVTPQRQTNSIPPSIGGEVKFAIATPALNRPAEEVTLGYSYRNDAAGRKLMALDAPGEVIVGAVGNAVRVVVPADAANLRVYQSVLKKKANKND